MKQLSHRQIAHLVKRAQKNDSAAFAALYAATVEHQLGFAKSFLRDPALAEDAVQEVYISLYRSLHKIKDPQLFIAYLNRISYNTCVDYKKRMTRQKWELDNQELDVQLRTEPKDVPDSQYDLLEQIHGVYAAMGNIPSQQRAAFLMRHYHDMKIRDIAVAMDCSESTVKRLIKSAILNLKQELAPE